MAEEINHDRRRFFSTVAMTIAAAQFDMIGSAAAQTSRTKPASLPPIKPGTNKSFGPLKQIDTGLLNVGYAEMGPSGGPPVILLHGWPYDIHSFVDVAPPLTSTGYRVIVPYVRGYGTTRFLSNETLRNGQPSALAVDIIDFMDALKIEKATLAGFDWGARTANIIAVLWPERCKAMVSVSGYLIGSQESGRIPLRQRMSSNGGTNIILPPNAAGPAMRSIVTILPSSFGRSLHRSGSSIMPLSSAAQHPSTIRITSASSSIIIAGDLDWLKASRSTMSWKSGLPHFRLSLCRRLPFKGMPTVRRVPTRVRTRRNSRASIRTDLSRAASGTICLRKLRRRLPRLSSTSTVIDRR
jgi:pimeloyl-ACP methyl ester carboxylesterase